MRKAGQMTIGKAHSRLVENQWNLSRFSYIENAIFEPSKLKLVLIESRTFLLIILLIQYQRGRSRITEKEKKS